MSAPALTHEQLLRDHNDLCKRHGELAAQLADAENAYVRLAETAGYLRSQLASERERADRAEDEARTAEGWRKANLARAEKAERALKCCPDGGDFNCHGQHDKDVEKVRAETLEEAAKVADTEAARHRINNRGSSDMAASDVATAIRALKTIGTIEAIGGAKP